MKNSRNMIDMIVHKNLLFCQHESQLDRRPYHLFDEDYQQVYKQYQLYLVYNLQYYLLLLIDNNLREHLEE